MINPAREGAIIAKGQRVKARPGERRRRRRRRVTLSGALGLCWGWMWNGMCHVCVCVCVWGGKAQRMVCLMGA